MSLSRSFSVRSFSFGGARTEVRFVEPLDVGSAASRLGGPVVLVFDSNTWRLFGRGLSPQVAAAAVVLPAGERAKSWGSVQAIIGRCAKTGLARDGWVMGVGGGVVCDVAGLAASLYMRGCRLALVPTTLLAMVDASIGGKTGIDFARWKNLVGTFYPASLVLIGIGALSPLSEREYRSGLAEAIKSAVIGDAELLDLLESRRDDVLAREVGVMERIVGRSLAVKGAIVEADPREDGRRAVLNLGHTFGHALESAMRFRDWTHGEAVAWGMAKAAELGGALGITEGRFAERLRVLLAAYGFRLVAPVGWKALLPALSLDKKRRAGRLRFAVPRRAGEVTVEEVESEVVSRVLGGGGGR